MRRGPLHTAAGWTVVFVALACEKSGEPQSNEPTAGSKTAAASQALGAPSVPSAPVPEISLPTLPTQVCRALTVTGRIQNDRGDAVAARAELDGKSWLELADGASMSVKHAKTAREVRLNGPGRFLPCYEGSEVFLVHNGRIETTFGLGARPGAEVLIATPFGIVSYGDATLRAVVGESALEVEVRQGEAWLEGTSRDEAPEKITKGNRGARAAEEANVKTLLTRCEKAAQESEARARAVLDRKADKKTLGARAAAHLRARQSARKACGIAAAAVGQKAPLPNAGDLHRRLRSADALWRRVPGRAKPPKD